MRDVQIKCDRCGQTIPDKVIKVSIEKVPRSGPILRWEYLNRLSGLDFCEQCAQDIAHFCTSTLYETDEQTKKECQKEGVN